VALTIKTTRTRNGWRYRLTKRESPPITLRHQHARLKMSGLRWQVWAHYASGGNGRWSVVRSFRGIVVPHWLR
jgi:hypothetical protein